jgi:hypothetical protein
MKAKSRKGQKVLLFKRHLAAQIRAGTKTQTRRISKIRYCEGSIQPIQENYSEKAKDHIKINKRYEQRLGDMTEEQTKAEGFNALKEFKENWIKLYGDWNPNQFVTAYEFRLVAKTNTLSSAEEPHKP